MTNSNKNIVIEFTKIEGTGNDFVLIDNRDSRYNFSYSDFSKIVCDRHRGVGADGLLVIENSERSDFKMRYLNADGSEGGMCGNGGRCIAKYLLVASGKQTTQFEALDYIYSAEIVDNKIRLLMNNPTDFRMGLKIQFENNNLKMDYVNTGAPHSALFIEDMPQAFNNFEKIEVNKIGRYIRYHELFSPAGTNVNFINKIGRGEVQIRTYERGVENETLSCGTGSIASAILAAMRYNWDSPIKVLTRSKDTLVINFINTDNKITNVSIEGPANQVFTGTLNYSIEEKNINE
ncbi:MAG: diaminopimelate epimerase [Bacteroidota bacterium]|nr:diaminopimelate epimerase [Bacteroidota bacterium]